MSRRIGLTFATLAALLLGPLLGGVPPSTALAGDAGQFEYERRSLPQLSNARTWILQGELLPGGGCRYRYESASMNVPANGWEVRSIGIDMSTCRKRMEEGTPSQLSSVLGDGTSTSQVLSQTTPGATESRDPAGAEIAAASTTRSAWQIVVWSDLLGYPVNHDGTEITWTYNGTSVLSGNAGGYWYRVGGWELLNNNVSQGFFSGAFRGQTNATFRNQGFCWPVTVYTYYFYNRMWGHANGTATRAQSSDSVNECLPLHVTISSAYGKWPY